MKRFITPINLIAALAFSFLLGRYCSFDVEAREQNVMYHQLFIEQVAVAYPDRGVAWIMAAAKRAGVDTNRLVIPGSIR